MKKIIYTLFTGLMIMTLSVFNIKALPSIVLNGTVDGYVLQYGKIVDGSYAVFNTMEKEVSIENVPTTIQKQIQQLNQGESIKEVLDIQKVQTKLDLSNYSLLTQIQDLKAYDNQGNVLDKEVTVSWEVPNLTKENSCKLCILHYSTKRNVWETIQPDQIDLENNKITVSFKDLSPVAVLYDSTNTCDATNSNTTNTGVQSHVSYYTILASVAILVGIVLILFGLKKNKK